MWAKATDKICIGFHYVEQQSRPRTQYTHSIATTFESCCQNGHCAAHGQCNHIAIVCGRAAGNGDAWAVGKWDLISVQTWTQFPTCIVFSFNGRWTNRRERFGRQLWNVNLNMRWDAVSGSEREREKGSPLSQMMNLMADPISHARRGPFIN